MTDTATTDISTLSLHDALPISDFAAGRPLQMQFDDRLRRFGRGAVDVRHFRPAGGVGAARGGKLDRKSTRLNSSHVSISYAVFCLKKKKDFPAEIQRGACRHHN